MCACLCACVSVCTRVCALGIPSPPPPTGGSVRPSAWSARPGRHGPERTPSVETARGHSTSYPAGRAAPRPRHTPPPPHPGPQRKFGFWGSPGLSLSGWPPPAKRGAQRLSPRRGGSLPASGSRGPRTYLAERDVPREGDPVARGSPAGGGRKGALTSARLIPAARGPARGSGPAAAVSEVGGARSPGCGPCRRGGRRWESAALRVRAAAATAASSVGSRRTEPPKPELPTCY